ncbi:MAG: hypothetical protein OEX23_06020 [Betaproteobacteria bacterium]|jgi:peptidoglycan/LPS O-acetylase OafA/YrhL|nr:hypothetical protein [Betaproteobacteria bacterium]
MERHRGWALLIVLVALAIVAYLARDALTQYFSSVTAASRPQDRLPPAAVDAAATPAQRAPVERARGAEAMVLERAQEGARHVDEQAR